jgi:hypothetical protein
MTPDPEVVTPEAPLSRAAQIMHSVTPRSQQLA